MRIAAAALIVVAAVALAACGDDSDDGDASEVATLPDKLDPPSTEDELAFCLGRLVDPDLTDPQRYELVSACTELDREAVEAHPDFVACLSGVARDVPNDRVQDRVDRCLAIFGDVEPATAPPEPPE
jgi:hypothetical protein